MQRFGAVEGHGQVCTHGTLGYRAGIGVDAAGQVHRQQQCTVLVLPIH